MVNIYFYQNVSGEETSKSIKKYLKEDFPAHKFIGASGKALELHNGNFVIWTHKDAKKIPSTLAHECLHITNMILHKAGIFADHDNDEAQAYLLGYLMKKCLSFK